MSATCERCGATVTGSVCELCGGTRLVTSNGASVPPPPPAFVPQPQVPPAGGPTPPAWVNPATGQQASSTGFAAPPPRTPTGAGGISSMAQPANRPNGQKIALVSIAAGLSLVLVVGGIVLAARGGTTAAAPLGAGSTRADEPNEQASATATAAQPTSPASATTTMANEVRCWNGSVKSSLSDCTEPRGAAAIRYVYPEYDAAGSCAKMNYREGRTVTFDCTLDKNSLVRYRWWRDKAEAIEHYDSKYAKGSCQVLTAAGQEIGVLCRDKKRVDGQYRMSGFFRDHFSFSVEATTKSRQDELLDTIVMRHPDDFAGYSLADGSKGTVHVLS